MMTRLWHNSFAFPTRAIALAMVASLFAVGCDGFRAPEAETLIDQVASVRTDRQGFDWQALRKGADYWSGWRGGHAAGVSDHANLPTHWSATDGIGWKVEIPGQGNSSPIVWGDRIWLTTTLGVAEGPDGAERHRAEGEGSAGSSSARRNALLCFDRSSGRLLWEREASLVPSSISTHRKNGNASATPAASEQYVVASFGDTGLYCFNHAGDLQWQVEQPGYTQQWGTASSPVILHDLVIQVCDTDSGESAIQAYRLQNGELVWRTVRPSYGSWSTPILIQVETPDGPTPELIVNGTGTNDGSPGLVIAYDPRTGQELWKVEGTTDIPCPTALFDGRRVLSTSGGNGPILAIDRSQPSAEEAHERASAPRVAWSHDSGGPYVPTGVVYQDHLYLISDGGRLCCYRTDDGELLWRQRLNGSFSASLVAGDGKIYSVSEQGEVRVIAADPEKYQLLAANDLGEQCLATPAIVEGGLLFRTERHLVFVEPSSEGQSPADAVAAPPAETNPSPSDLQPVAAPSQPGPAGGS